jgi:hypothetical protein
MSVKRSEQLKIRAYSYLVTTKAVALRLLVSVLIVGPVAYGAGLYTAAASYPNIQTALAPAVGVVAVSILMGSTLGTVFASVAALILIQVASLVGEAYIQFKVLSSSDSPTVSDFPSSALSPSASIDDCMVPDHGPCCT